MRSIQQTLRKTQKNLSATKSYFKRQIKRGRNLKQDIDDIQFEQMLKSRYSPNHYILLKNQYKHKKRIKWSKKAKEISLLIYYTSPKAYNLLRTFQKLPTVSTLRLFTRKLKIQPGFSKGLFKQLFIKCQSIDEEDRKCFFLMDEMSLKTNLRYNRGEDKLYGVEDFGSENRGNRRANVALVLMIVGIKKKWKQHVAFFFSYNTIKSNILEIIIMKSVALLRSCGFNVVGITTDQGQNFLKAFKQMGCTENDPKIVVDGRSLCYE